MPYIFAPAADPSYKRATRAGCGAVRCAGGKAKGMWRIIKALIVLALLGIAGLSAYAYLADMRPEQSEIKVPVTLNAVE